MAKRYYLDFDSTYRDRTRWPNPGEFEVLINQGPTADQISTACPVLEWTSNRFNASIPISASISGVVIGGPGIGATNSPDTIIFSTGPGELQQNPNYYRRAVIQTPTANTRILEYRYLKTDTGMLKVDKDLSLTPGDIFTIHDPTDLTDPAAGIIFIPSDDWVFSQADIIYNESLGQSRPIMSFDKPLGTLTTTNVSGWLASHNYSIRKASPILTTTAGVGSTTTNVVITGGSTSDLYSKSFIRMLRTVYNNTTIPPEGETRQIISYNGGTTTATVFPAFTGPTAGQIFEVLQLSGNNWTPFTYRGTLELEAAIYKIRLLSLVLPNRMLVVGQGGRIAFYPYVYVELSAGDVPGNYLLMSNNPNAVKVMFKASIDDIQNLTNSTFISLNGDDTEQILRFRLSTNFKVRVILPTGETFKTVEVETLPPKQPNLQAQLNMLFQLIPV